MSNSKDQSKSSIRVAEQIGSEAARMEKKAAEGGRTAVQAGKDRLAGKLGQLAQALEEAATELEKQDSLFATLPKAVSRRTESASAYLAERELVEIGSDVRSFAKNNPACFVAASAVTGLIAARFIRSPKEAMHASTPRKSTPGGWWSDNPLLAGLLALAAGGVIGWLIPMSRSEARWLGPAKQRAREAGGQKVREFKDRLEENLEKAKDIAQDAAREARETITQHSNELDVPGGT